MASWGISEEAQEAAVLLVSELVTNALLHGTPPVTLLARRTRRGARVEVHDADPTRHPTLRPAQTELAAGRGLRLVDALASRWGWSPSSHGKGVWFEVDAGADGSGARLSRGG